MLRRVSPRHLQNPVSAREGREQLAVRRDDDTRLPRSRILRGYPRELMLRVIDARTAGIFSRELTDPRVFRYGL